MIVETTHQPAPTPTALAAKRVYLDYHSTTPVDPRVVTVVAHHMTTTFGNPSSSDHTFGDDAEAVVDAARKNVAALVGAESRQIVFTSGATESLNLALKGLVARFQKRGKIVRIAHSPVEHRAVLDTCRALLTHGTVALRPLIVDSAGRLDLDDLEDACRAGVDVVCVMAANNEIGTTYPVDIIAEITKRYGALLLCDATQAAGKVPLEFGRWGVDLLAISAHKFYGPKGVGALLVERDGLLEPLIHGGGQQRGLRSGTLNVPAIAGLGEACRLRTQEMAHDEPQIAALRNSFQFALTTALPSIIVNGAPEARLAGSLHISIPGVPNSAVIARVRDWLAVATGAACTSGIEGPSHVLRAIGLPQALQDSALRLCLGKFTTEEETELATELLLAAVVGARRVLTGQYEPASGLACPDRGRWESRCA